MMAKKLFGHQNDTKLDANKAIIPILRFQYGLKYNLFMSSVLGCRLVQNS